MAENGQHSLQAAKPITLIPVGLKEAALDSPTFRSSFTHFSEQLELVEKWLETYVRCISRLTNEVGNFEALINNFLSQTVPPTQVSEAVLDHDYTLLAMKRYGEGAKDFWTATIKGLKKMEVNMVQPIKVFLENDLRSFRNARRNFDQTQRQLDHLQSRYAAQAKNKEASSLREDAFQLHEARKAYLQASMDFGVMAPQLRMRLDKMLVNIFADQWRDMRDPRSHMNSSIEKWENDIDRVKGWSREMENGEKVFLRELHNSRRQIEEKAEMAVRPSRELEEYAVDSASASRSRGPSTATLPAPNSNNRPSLVRADKQGWLNLRTVSGKPSRTIWLRRWFYIKNGIFGWLVQGTKSGAVEESDRIGVLLCNVKPGNSDDRRYVFEVKTKDTTIIVQAETQAEINNWLAVFDVAKQKALEDPASTESQGLGSRAQDPAFAILPPSAPEFAASAADAGMPLLNEDNVSGAGIDRISTLPVPGGDVVRNSFDVSASRRSVAQEKDVDSGRDPTSRLIQKLDLHRKPLGSAGTSSPSSPGLTGGGIASLIAASHGSMPVGPGVTSTPPPQETSTIRKTSSPLSLMRDLPTSSLAPNTLANPPAPTNLSVAAVIVNGEGRAAASGSIPSGLMANVWGTSNWGFLNRLERGEVETAQAQLIKLSNSPSPRNIPSVAGHQEDPSSPKERNKSTAVSPAPSPSHRKTNSLDGNASEQPNMAATPSEFPNYYPLQLKTQDAQFRLLFPNVRRDEKVVLVFKAAWNPNEQQEFPGRVYVTAKEIYFYSNHCGMTMTTSLRLDSISDVTAASGRDWDVLFVHIKEATEPSGSTRMMMKTFLEPIRLLQRRLKYLVRNAGGDGVSIEEIMKALIKMEQDDPESSPSVDSWENVSVNTPVDGGSTPNRQPSKNTRDLRANVFIDRGLYGDAGQSDGKKKISSKPFKLPKQPVLYVPSGMHTLAIERDYDISPKALFHVLFGDKSAVWQLLYHERHAQHIRQGPWTQPQGHFRRDFEYEIEFLDILRRLRQATVTDHQVIDSANEHLLYCISDRKTPWHLPYRASFTLLSKIVITHVAKSKCRLAIHIQVEWMGPRPFFAGITEQAALHDMSLDALDLADVLSDQVRRLVGGHGRTKKAVAIFGQIGQSTQVSEFAGSDSPINARLRRTGKQRTLLRLSSESVVSMLETILTSTLQILIRLSRWGLNIVNANSLLVLILILSILSNVMFSTTSTTYWWKNRKAQKFMSGIGVEPDLTMTKAIYLHDLDDAISFEMENTQASDSMCRDAFHGVMNMADNEFAYTSALKSPQSTSFLRMRNSRQHLGSRRHDLLVAMRVVNNIEREMTQAEWETWLLAENAKCSQLGWMIEKNQTKRVASQDGQRLKPSPMDASKMAEMKSWYQSYCASCSREQEFIYV